MLVLISRLCRQFGEAVQHFLPSFPTKLIVTGSPSLHPNRRGKRVRVIANLQALSSFSSSQLM